MKIIPTCDTTVDVNSKTACFNTLLNPPFNEKILNTNSGRVFFYTFKLNLPP